MQQFAQTAYQTQQATEWCWAASISMIWAFHGHPLSQAEIVAGELGQVINQPGQAWQIFQALNGTRTDDNGATFSSVVSGLYDYADGYDNISYSDIEAALVNNRPVLIGTVNPDGSGSHATVLSELVFDVPAGYDVGVAPDGSNVVSATVFDPWPASGGITTMYQPQIAPAGKGGGLFFAAIVDVSTEQQPGSGSGGQSGQGGKGAIDEFTLIGGVGLLFLSSLRSRGRAGLRGTTNRP